MILPQNSQLHLWYVRLDEDLYQNSKLRLLAADEIQRAHRFRFELHRKRFITARAGLRSILSLYLNIRPEEIQFSAGPKGKPEVAGQDLQFNLSHSHDVALYALTYRLAVGVDVEKIRSQPQDDVAQRFFSAEEYETLSKLPLEARRTDFYRIWTGKEALIKALGEGLSFSLSSFSLPAMGKSQEIFLSQLVPPQTWFLENLDLFPDYRAAVVTQEKLTRLSYFEWTDAGEKKWREDELRSLL